MEEVQRQERVATSSVRATMATNAMSLRQSVQRPKTQLCPKLVMSWAKPSYRYVESLSALWQRAVVREEFEKVPHVVRTREGKPPWRRVLMPDQVRSCESSTKLGRVDALRSMARKVDTRSSEERHRFLRVKVDGDVKFEIEAPDPPEATVRAAHCNSNLDGP
jgi:hypothetical protein